MRWPAIPPHDFGNVALHPRLPGDHAAPGAGGDGPVRAGDRPGGRALPSPLRSRLESRFGEAFGDVRIHQGPVAREAARRLGARAFTVEADVVLGAGVEASALRDARDPLLVHELTHVVQHRRAGGYGGTGGGAGGGGEAAGGRPLRRDAVAPEGSDAEREARRMGRLAALGLPLPPVRSAHRLVALTPTSERVAYDLSYALNDLAVTAEEETRILAALQADTDLSRTIVDLRADGMLSALFDRIDEPGNRSRLLHILGAGLDAPTRALVEPLVRRWGTGAELQFNLGRLGVTSGAPAFNPSVLERAVVGTSRTSRMGTTGGFLTDPFTGVGATGVIPVTRYAGTFHTTPGLPGIPVEDQARLALGDPATEATYSNPLGNLFAYLGGLSATERTQQAELLLRRPIASVEAASYEGDLPSRAQVVRAAARAHNLHGALVAGIILAEQRDQTQAEDAKDVQAATSILQGNTSIGLGQVVVSTARSRDLFADLMSDTTRSARRVDSTSAGGHGVAATLLASDEYNILAVARYIRQVADQGATKTAALLPRTAAAYPGINFPAYAGNSSTWPDDNIRALGSEYTSRAWDDNLSTGWGEFVFQAYQDVRGTGLI